MLRGFNYFMLHTPQLFAKAGYSAMPLLLYYLFIAAARRDRIRTLTARHFEIYSEISALALQPAFALRYCS